MTRRAALLVLLVATTAAAQTPAKMILPGFVSGSANHKISPDAADEMTCATVPAEYTMTATKIAGRFTGTSGTCGVAVYPDSDGGTALLKASGPCSGSIVSASGLAAANFTAGTFYRVCECSSIKNTNAYLSVEQEVVCCSSFPISKLVQTFTPTLNATSANPCVSGVPPSTTGARTAVTGSIAIPLVLVEQ